jgi:septal ring factor EnvC (AmiA/AmiB activator)
VIFADYLRGYGNLVIVDHGDKFMSLYANNGSLLKKLGDKVSTHDTLATVGKNGTMPISGLYFEIRRSGQPVDPSDWIKKHL